MQLLSLTFFVDLCLAFLVCRLIRIRLVRSRCMGSQVFPGLMQHMVASLTVAWGGVKNPIQPGNVWSVAKGARIGPFFWLCTSLYSFSTLPSFRHLLPPSLGTCSAPQAEGSAGLKPSPHKLVSSASSKDSNSLKYICEAVSALRNDSRGPTGGSATPRSKLISPVWLTTLSPRGLQHSQRLSQGSFYYM